MATTSKLLFLNAAWSGLKVPSSPHRHVCSGVSSLSPFPRFLRASPSVAGAVGLRAASSSASTLHPVFDSHTHIGMTLKRLKEKKPIHVQEGEIVSQLMERDEEKVRTAAGGEGFELVGCINVNCWADAKGGKSFDAGLKIQKEEERVFGTYGVHPHEASKWSGDVERRMREALSQDKSVAVGECGLDFYRNLSSKEEQEKAFRAQMRIANELKLPLVVHARDAEAEALAMMKEELPADAAIHLHCYTGSLEDAERFLGAFPALCIGFTGCISFPKLQPLRAVVQAVPLHRILIETDAPFMAPVPLRGAPCHSGMLPLVAHAVSGVHGVPVGEVARTTTANARRLYRIPAPPGP